MKLVRITTMLLLQAGQLTLSCSDGEIWSVGLVASLCGLVPEWYRLAARIAQLGLVPPP